MITIARTAAERMTLLAYMASKIGVTPAQLVGDVAFDIAAVHRAGKPVGAVLYQNKRRHTVEMAWAGEPGWLTKGDIRQMWSHAFAQPGILTVLGTIRVGNAASRNMAERMGCELIGTVPHTYGEGEHALLYCMRRDACRWVDMSADLKINAAG
jgi:RimJ/RimL family protein N-acetyltransferase